MRSSWVICIKILLTVFISESSEKLCHKACPAEEKMPWSYNYKLPNGPPNWGNLFPNCGGNLQSPINIDSKGVILDGTIEPLQMIDYSPPITEAKLTNIGHTVKVTPTDDVDRFIIVNGTAYFLQFFDFHWTDNEAKRPAGNTIDGKNYAFAVHMIHTSDEEKYAMVSVAFEASADNNPAFDPIIDLLDQVSYKRDEIDLRSDLNLMDFVDAAPSFFQYTGSQTVPPCNEGFTWVVCKKPKSIGRRQVKAFRQLFYVEKGTDGDTGGCRILQNARQLQPLKDRNIYSSL